jgi:predicted anti-sigma-YlaC factor YlaD
MNAESIPPPPIRYRLMQSIMWPFMKLLRMTCRDTFQLCSEQMDRPLNFPEKLRLHLHLAMCGLCRKLPIQLANQRALLHTCLHEDPHPDPQSPTLPDEVRVRIHQHLNQHPTP